MDKAEHRSCQAPHFQYHVSGRLAIRMDDGAEEPVVVTVDWFGAGSYARRS